MTPNVGNAMRRRISPELLSMWHLPRGGRPGSGSPPAFKSSIRRPSPSNQQHTTNSAAHACFHCHEEGHIATNCPKRGTVSRSMDSNSFNRTPRVNEIETAELPEERGSDYESDSENRPPQVNEEDLLNYEILSLREMTPSASQELISSKPFVIHGSLTCQGKVYSIQILIDTGCTGCAFIDRKLIGEICDLLGIVPMPLAKPKRVRGLDGKISKALITHAL